MTLAIAACGDGSTGRLARQVQLELRVAGITVVDAVAAPDDATHVTIVPPACHPGAPAAVVVRAPGRPPLRRALEIEGDGAERVLALALVSALREAWARPPEAQAQPPTAEELAAARASERAALRRSVDRRFAALSAAQSRARAARERAERARRALPPWDLFLGGELLGYLEGGAGLLGGAAGGGLTIAGPLRLALEAAGGYGVARDALGEVRFGALRGVLALELHVRAAPMTGFAGVWLGAGWSHAEGSADDPELAGSGALDAGTGALGLRVGGAFELSASWSLFARVDGGYGFGGVAANAAAIRRVAATRGAILRLSIGVRLHP